MSKLLHFKQQKCIQKSKQVFKISFNGYMSTGSFWASSSDDIDILVKVDKLKLYQNIHSLDDKES